MVYTLEEYRQNIMSDIFKVYRIFQDYFDPSHVDLHFNNGITYDDAHLLEILNDTGSGEGTDDDINTIKNSLCCSIIVWWPTVTITNEYNKSVTVKDLYAKIDLTTAGRIPYISRGFQLVRTTFSEDQFFSGYIHSHIMHFSNKPAFSDPCLGRGPINNTIMDLKNDYNEVSWLMFCRELSLYVTVESLTGGPYMKLENIHNRRGTPIQMNLYHSEISNLDQCVKYFSGSHSVHVECIRNVLEPFILYYITHNHLTFGYRKGAFKSTTSFYDYMLDISNAFIDWFNANGNKDTLSTLFNHGVLTTAVAVNGKLYKEGDSIYGNRDLSVRGSKILSFKGRDILLQIEQVEGEEHPETLTILQENVAQFILNNILRTINYRYGDIQYSEGEHTDSPSTRKAVLYI